MKETDIRPKEIFDEYLRLAKIDTETYFKNALREKINCPACDANGRHSFSKHNFDYFHCDNCYTLYVNPRPVSEAFSDYYTNSPSTEFWATTFYKETEDARREKIWKPKAKIILDTLKKQKVENCQLVDIGGGYGIFAEEIEKIYNQPVTIIEPGPQLADVCRKKGFQVIDKFLEDVSVNELPNGQKCFVSFELFEHLHSPKMFLNQLYNLMNPNDLFIFTTLSSTGLDILTLWENSPSVSPPHHLNFLNPKSISLILQKTGLRNIKITTPGELDIDILSNNINNVDDRFWNTFIRSASEKEKIDLQNYLAINGFSSHMMIVCQK